MRFETMNLSEIIEIKKGKYITKKDSKEGPYPVILGGREPAYYIDQYNHTGKAIVVSRSGASAGYVSFWNEPIFVTDGFLIEPKENVNIDFLYYLMKAHESEFLELQGGSAIPHVTPKIIGAVSIGLPLIKIQVKIADVLSAYDELIANNQKQIKLLEEAAKRLYKEWFVDLRFPGHEDVAIIDGVPEGWKKCDLQNIAILKAGGDRPKVFSKERNLQCSVPVYSNGTEKEGLYGYTDIPVIQDDCVTISARGSVGYTCLRRTAFVPIVRLISVIPKSIDVIYLYLYLKNFKFDSNGAAQQQITVPMIKEKPVLIPKKEIIEDFLKIVKSMYDAIENCKEQIEKLIEARDRLLPKLMSGEIEV